MSTPRTLKSALEAGSVICKLYAKYDKNSQKKRQNLDK